ncbi:MAG: ABC transporter permease [Dehalococcoidia bacterium]|nr:ABC transporter permease [Dehalococcoidia bacterium]
MSNILTISKREITRLRSRFTGKSRLVMVGILALVMILSYVIYHQELSFSKGLYTIGVSSDAPVIADQRFTVLAVDPDSASTMIDDGTIDVYLGKDVVGWGSSEKSQCALGALKKYLEKQELNRIAQEYEIDQAFPLRIEVQHLQRDGDDVREKAQKSSIADALNSSWKNSEVSVAAGPPPAAKASESQVAPALAAPTPLQSGTPAFSPSNGSSVKRVDSSTDAAVRDQLKNMDSGGLPQFKAEFTSDNEIIVPSLLNPPIPLSQVLLAFLYIVPIFFVSVFFTSSFIEEKTNRKLVILMSAPITPSQIILGKMLPYIGYSIGCIIAITLVLKGNVLIALAIFIPVMLFILSVYLMVALLYRTFKDQTFFSVLAVWIITAYLVAPAMFSDTSDLSHISPLTLAVEMYRGESFSIAQYFLSTIPMYLVFAVTMFIGTRIFNEEFLMGFRPLHTKLSEAAYLAIDQNHLKASIFVLSLCLVPVVFMAQFASIVIASNLNGVLGWGVILALAVVTEEIAKSTGIFVLLQNKVIGSLKSVVVLSFLSALGFLIGEKLLLYLALSVMDRSEFTDAIFGSGMLLVPLALHFVCTTVVCLIPARLGVKYYALGIFAGVVIHGIYNMTIILEALS